MKNGANFAAKSNPSRNSHFSRHWTDDPLDLRDFQHLKREVTPKVAADVGRRTIGRWLDKASETYGASAAKAFQEADAIRRKMGLDWGALIEQRGAS